MLTERAIALTQKISHYKQLKGAAREAEKYATRSKQFETLAEKLAALRVKLQAMKAAGVDVDFRANDGAAYADKAKVLRLAIAKEPTTIEDPPFDLKYAFMDRLNGLVAAGEKALGDGWRTHVNGRADFVSGEVLDALGRVPAFRDAVGKVKQRHAAIETVASAAPDNPGAALADLEALIVEYKAAWAKLAADDLPQGVVAFIRRAASDGAGLELFTPAVRTWLQSRDLLSAFAIRLR
jgi:hypothetical protein